MRQSYTELCSRMQVMTMDEGLVDWMSLSFIFSGISDLQKRIREHIALARELASWIWNHPEFEIL